MAFNAIYTFSGIDGVGKTTQASLLLDAFRAMGKETISLLKTSDLSPCRSVSREEAAMARIKNVILSRFYYPSEKTRFLQKEITGSRLLDSPERGKELAGAAALSAAEDARAWFEIAILPLLDAGKTVIFDRFTFDEIAYRSLYGVDQSLLEQMFFGFPTPKIAFLIELSAQHVIARNKNRPDVKTELLNRLDKIKLLNENFSAIAHAHGLVVVDGSHAPGRVHRQVLESINL